jgi:hypothetical protein
MLLLRLLFAVLLLVAIAAPAPVAADINYGGLKPDMAKCNPSCPARGGPYTGHGCKYRDQNRC